MHPRILACLYYIELSRPMMPTEYPLPRYSYCTSASFSPMQIRALVDGFDVTLFPALTLEQGELTEVRARSYSISIV